MAKRGGPLSQGWRAFLHNYADGIAAMNLFVVPTVSFRLLYGLLILQPGRRQILWLGSLRTPRLNGSLASSRRPMVGQRRRDTSSATATLSMGTSSSAGLKRWAFVIDRQRHDHRGKTDMRNG